MNSHRDSAALIQVQDIYKQFSAGSPFWGKRQYLHAVNGVNFHIFPGETLGLVGESGCGKSTVGNMLLRLLSADEGKILFKGKEFCELEKSNGGRKELGKIQAVFQDPQSSLDPLMRVEQIVGSPLLLWEGLKKEQRTERVRDILRETGLGDEHLSRYPHEFSGGQRQRIGIARALVSEPEFIVFDEPTSALDVSVQAQILNLIKDLQNKHGYAYLFISHDLAVIRHISHRVAVMYLGHIVETASRDNLFDKPMHPYTRALMDSVPEPDPLRRKTLAVLEGDVPSPVFLPSGCPFHPRCPEAMPICQEKKPPLHTEKNAHGDEHHVECWLYGNSGAA